MPSRPPGQRHPLQRRAGWVVYLVLSVVAVVAVLVVRGSLWDRRPSYVADFTAAELRERPDITEVLPDAVDGTRALLGALRDDASLTWEPADPQVFAHEYDGVEEQVVDGYPVLRWKPEHWDSVGHAPLDDAAVAALAQTFRQTLEPLGYSVSTVDRSTGRNRHLVHFIATDEHGSSLQLLDVNSEGMLRVIALTTSHLYRSDTCDPDPLACRPTVEDPAAGL